MSVEIKNKIEQNNSNSIMSAPSKRAIDKHARRERSLMKFPQKEEKITRTKYLIEKLSDFFMFD